MTPTLPEILSAVSDVFGVTVDALMSDRRDRGIARPRQVVAYLAKMLTPHSTIAVGNALGRDHTTVMHAVRVVEGLRTGDRAFAAQVQNAQNRCLAASGMRPPPDQRPVPVGEVVEALRGVARECNRAASLLDALSKNGESK